MDFTPWPKIARLNRNIVVTEKIDGTNAAIVIVPWEDLVAEVSDGHNWTEEYYRRWAIGPSSAQLLTIVGTPITKTLGACSWVEYDHTAWAVFAQSRTRVLTPDQDNFGFASWVTWHAEDLVGALGPGTHFGEWWGSGIQRGYDQPWGVKHFSLFNSDRFAHVDLAFEDGSRVRPVPVLHRGTMDTINIETQLQSLRLQGSSAAPGFTRPEGVVVFHTAARQMFKVTLQNDHAPKGQ